MGRFLWIFQCPCQYYFSRVCCLAFALWLLFNFVLDWTELWTTQDLLYLITQYVLIVYGENSARSQFMVGVYYYAPLSITSKKCIVSFVDWHLPFKRRDNKLQMILWEKNWKYLIKLVGKRCSQRYTSCEVLNTQSSPFDTNRHSLGSVANGLCQTEYQLHSSEQGKEESPKTSHWQKSHEYCR